MPTFVSQQHLGHLLGDFYSRRLLLHNPLHPPPPISPLSSTPSSSSDQLPGNNSFDDNVVMVLSVLLCALICSLGLNSIIKCALRCSTFISSSSSSSLDTINTSTRLANTGVKKKALKTFPTITYSPELKLPALDTECMICLSEFIPSERVRLLPKCNHGFHVMCINKWLSSHSSCPKCRQSLIETCQKIVGFSQAVGSSSEMSMTISSLAVQETRVSIVALQPEGYIRNYRGVIS